jgi:hypothetical protein
MFTIFLLTKNIGLSYNAANYSTFNMLNLKKLLKPKYRNTLNPFHLANSNDLSHHLLKLIPTSSGIMLFTQWSDVDEDTIKHFKNFINICYEAKQKFKTNNHLKTIKFYLKENKYNIITESIIYHHYADEGFCDFIASIKKEIIYTTIKDSENEAIYLNGPAIEENLGFIKSYLEKSQKDNKKQCYQHLILKEKEELEDIIKSNQNEFISNKKRKI